MRTKLLVAALVLASASVGRADDGLTKGTPEPKSVTSMAFGPKGLLFFADSAGATIFAVDTGDTKSAGNKELNIEGLDKKIADTLGGASVRITDVKVNPTSGNVFVSAAVGTGAGTPALVKVTRDGTVSAFAMKDVPFASVKIPNPTTAAPKGGGTPQVVTQLAFVDGKVIVSGLSSEQFASTLWVIPFPFKEAGKGTPVEIYHGNHGALETRSPIRSFVSYKVGKEESIISGYTCTPLVKIPVSELKPGEKVKGTTIAELGNRNTPLDMIVYTKGGKDYILMTNDNRGVMKIPTDEFGTVTPVTTKAAGTAGVKYETIKELTDVVQMDKLNDDNALILLKNGNLKTVPLP